MSSIRKQIAQQPFVFWAIFYIFVLLITLPVLAYIGTISNSAPGALTVTINQKSGTDDPNPSYTSVFEVVFSDSIDEATFTSPDITLGGTAPGQSVQSITESGTFDQTTYDVRIEATGSGTITPSIAQELVAAQSSPTNTNNTSTSTDNSVTYDGTYAPDEFVTTWKTDNAGDSNSTSIIIPTTGGGYSYDVDWDNDGVYDQNSLTGDAMHDFGSPGTYSIRIKGTFPQIYFNNSGDKAKILEVNQWGSNQWSSMVAAFTGASNLTIGAIDSPNMSSVASMRNMFSNASSLNGGLSAWDVSSVTDMQNTFAFATSFNSSINNWDVSNVTNMTAMFIGASAFNQPLNKWEPGNVNMSNLFAQATSFNQPINSWDVSNVTNMTAVFALATSFDQPLDSWNVSSITDMTGMFYGASAFDQPLDSWNVSNVETMSIMFASGAGLSMANYDTTLTAWSALNLQNNVVFDAGASTYCNAENDRQDIIDSYSWTINDAGEGCPEPPEVSTLSATDITPDSSSLTGLSTPRGVSERGIQYGETASYGQMVEDNDDISYVYKQKWGSSGSGDGQFGTPYGMAVDSSNNVYVTDIGNNNIQKFDSDGNFITKWGSSGSGDGQFNGPYGLDTDGADNVYVVDKSNHRIQKFDSDGNFITKWGSYGTGDGRFIHPQGIGVDVNGFVYVVGSDNDRIQKFDSDGNFITKWGSSGSGDGQFNNPTGATVGNDGNIYVSDFYNNRIQKFDSDGNFITKWGSSGSGDGQFNAPYDVTSDSNGEILVVEGGNKRIQKFDSDGNFITKWGSYGSGDGQLNLPTSITVDSFDAVYIQDFLDDKVQKFTGAISVDISGLACGTTYHYRAYATNAGGTSYGDDQTFTTGDCPLPDVSTLSANSISASQAQLRGLASPRGVIEKGIEYGLTDSYGSKIIAQDGGYYTEELLRDDSQKSDFAIDLDGNLYVAFSSDSKIKKYDKNGNFVLEWGSFGDGNGQFDFPSGVSYDPTGYIYIADTSNQRIQKFDLSGNYISKIGTTDVAGSGNGQFYSPFDVFVDNQSNVYVADTLNHRVQKFDSDGNFISKFGTQGTGDGELDNLHELAVDSTGNVFVADYENDRIQKFDGNGVFVTKWSVNLHGIFTGIDIDSEDNIYVGNNISGGPTIQKYSNTGVLLNDDLDQYAGPIAIDRNDSIFSLNGASVFKQRHLIGVLATDLSCETTYHFRAYATNSTGTSYGEDMTVQTGSCTTDISLDINLINTVEVKQGEGVRYKFTARNEGPNNGYAEGLFYAILPKEFTFQSMETEGYGEQVMTVDIDSGSVPQVFKDNYPGQIFFGFTANSVNLENPVFPENGATIMNVGGSEEIIVKGIANTDFVINNTSMRGLFVPFSEFSFAQAIADATQNGQDYFTLPYNNVATHTYSYSEDSPNEPNQAPTVSLTAPENNYHFPSDTTQVDLAATAADPDGSISKVRFYLNDTYIGEDTNAPYSFTATNLSPGDYSVKAVAQDNIGAHTTSSPHVFTILAPGQPAPNPNPPPYTPPEPQTPSPPTEEEQAAFREQVAILGRLLEPTNAEPSLPELTKYIPWSILALLLAVASLMTYSTHMENRRRVAFEQLTNRFKASLEARAIYLQLTSHYIKTPITKMQASLELLAATSANSSSGGGANTMVLSVAVSTLTIPTDLIHSTQAIVKQLATHAGELLEEGQSLSGKQQANINILKNRKPLSVLSNPWFWIPASLIGLLTVLANFLLIGANVYGASIINYTVQMLLWIVGVVALAVALYFRQQAKTRQQIAKTQNEIEQETQDRQHNFIDKAHQSLIDDLDELALKQKEIAKYPKTESFNQGLKELEHILEQLAKVNQLSKYVPGLSYQTDLAVRLNKATDNLQPLADSKQVSISLRRSTGLSPVNLPEASLDHLIFAPLKNAIQQSSAGQQVLVTTAQHKNQTELTITDRGKGIPKDQIDNLFKPFTSVTDPKHFLDTGLGLDLYLAKVITEQYGGQISITNNQDTGATIKLQLPVGNNMPK